MKCRTGAVATAVVLACCSAVNAERIIVFADEPLASSLDAAAIAFQTDTKHTIIFTYEPSPALMKRMTGGENFDVTVIQPNFAATLQQGGKATLPGAAPFAKVGFGLAARADSTAASFTTTEEMKQVVLKAEQLAFNDRASGDHFASVLAKLDLTETVKAKVVRTPPAEVFARVAQSNGTVGVGTITQIKAAKGLKLIGALPAEHQSYIPYTVAVSLDAPHKEAAAAFASYITSPKAREAFVSAGATLP